MEFFRVVFLDRDKRTFGVSEIIYDDTSINSRTVALQKEGRNVNVSTATPLCRMAKDVESIDYVVNEALESLEGYSFDPNLHW